MVMDNESNGNILIADDYNLNLSFLSNVLQNDGYNVKTAKNGIEVLQLIKHNTFDLLLLDIVMPQMDGFEACEKLKENEETSDIPIIFITAIQDKTSIVKGFEMGAVDYITKPFNEDELLIRVKTQIDFIKSKQLLKHELIGRKKAEEELIKAKNEVDELVEKRTIKLQKEITERKEIEAELKKAKEDTEVAYRIKSEFLANISHEIRTPMNAILGFADLLYSQIDDTMQKNYLKSIKSSGSSLLRLINNILDYSKIEANKLQLQKVPVNLNSLFDEIERLFLLKTSQKDIKFITNISQSLPLALLIDEIRLSQILINLVGNAVKFTSSGYVKLSAKEIVSKKDGFIDLLFSIEDTGIGIEHDSLNSIFEPFKQQEYSDSKKYEGTGLGLAITKRLVELMGGVISVHSQIGKGSMFAIRFKDIKMSHFTQQKIKKPDFDFKNAIFDKTKILVVDDVDTNRKLVKVYCRSQNFEIFEADNGQKAIFMAKKIMPDIILMDIRMPVMDGYEANKIIKNNALLKHIPVIAITTIADNKETKKLIQTQFNGYLLKPIQLSPFFAELSKFIVFKLNIKTTNALKKIDIQKINRIDKLINALNINFMKKWKSAYEVKSFKEIKIFGSELIELANNHSALILKEYAEGLVNHIKSFDVENIESTLQQFPKLVDEIVEQNK